MFLQDSLQLRINLDCPLQLALNLVLLKNISIVGIHWGRYHSVEPERARKVWQELFACVPEGDAVLPRFFRLTKIPDGVLLTPGVHHSLIESGTLKAVVYSEVWPLERVADGLAALEQRKTWGKAVVRVREDDITAKL